MDIRYLNHPSNMDGVSDAHLQAWKDIDIEVSTFVREGILDLHLDRPLATFIPAPTANGAVAEMMKRWQIECAVRGLDSDFSR